MYSRPIGVASHFNGVRSRKTAVEQAPAAKDVGDVSRSLLYLGPVPFLARRTSIKTSPSRIHSTVSSTITNCSFPIYCFSPILGLAREVISQLLSAPALFVPATVLASYHVPVENCPLRLSMLHKRYRPYRWRLPRVPHVRKLNMVPGVRTTYRHSSESDKAIHGELGRRLPPAKHADS
jgi:hypothetical protein